MNCAARTAQRHLTRVRAAADTLICWTEARTRRSYDRIAATRHPSEERRTPTDAPVALTRHRCRRVYDGPTLRFFRSHSHCTLLRGDLRLADLGLTPREPLRS